MESEEGMRPETRDEINPEEAMPPTFSRAYFVECGKRAPHPNAFTSESGKAAREAQTKQNRERKQKALDAAKIAGSGLALAVMAWMGGALLFCY